MLAEKMDEFLREDRAEELNDKMFELLEQAGLDKVIAVLRHHHYDLRVAPDLTYTSVMLCISAHARDRCSEYIGTTDSREIARMLRGGQLLSCEDMLKLGYRPHRRHQPFSRYVKFPDNECVAVLSRGGKTADSDIWTLITIYNTVSSNTLRIPEEILTNE